MGKQLDGQIERTVVLLDNQRIVRQSLRALLESELGFNVVGEAGSGMDATVLVKRLQPDILICELWMTGISGFEVTREVGRTSPRTAVIILSMYVDNRYVVEALRCGAKAYVSKTAPPSDLINAFQEVSNGRRYLSPALTQQAINAYEISGHGLFRGDLTIRERQIFWLLVQGYANNDIAPQLRISRRTVEVHRANLMRKLSLRNERELVRYAAEEGFVPEQLIGGAA